MSDWKVRIVARSTEDAIPDRITPSSAWELCEAFGGPGASAADDDADPYAVLHGLWAELPLQSLAERLMELMLIEPPIPAYCETLVRSMKDPDSFPWRDHEVGADRFSLWFAHFLLHRALPDDFPEPTVECLSLEARGPSDASAPGRRSAMGDRAAFAAHLIAQGSHPLADPSQRTGPTWAWDAVWAARVTHRAVEADELVVRVDAWVPDVVAGALRPGDAWVAHLR